VLLGVSALVEGLRSSLTASGNPLQVMVLRKGGTAELNSVITRVGYQDIIAPPASLATNPAAPWPPSK
jgi:hypothetical protein